MFSTAKRFSYTKLTYYPGIRYEYGLIVNSKFSMDDGNFCEYQHWIVMNPHTNDIEFICVVDEQYDRPEIMDVFLR